MGCKFYNEYNVVLGRTMYPYSFHNILRSRRFKHYLLKAYCLVPFDSISIIQREHPVKISAVLLQHLPLELHPSSHVSRVA